MTPDFYLSEGDRRPSIPDSLSVAGGGTVNLTACGVTFTARRIGTNTVAIANKTATVTNPLYGQVQYDLDAADVLALKAGFYHCFWRVTFGDATTQRHPNDGFLLLKVSPS